MAMYELRFWCLMRTCARGNVGTATMSESRASEGRKCGLNIHHKASQKLTKGNKPNSKQEQDEGLNAQSVSHLPVPLSALDARGADVGLHLARRGRGAAPAEARRLRRGARCARAFRNNQRVSSGQTVLASNRIMVRRGAGCSSAA